MPLHQDRFKTNLCTYKVFGEAITNILPLDCYACLLLSRVHVLALDTNRILRWIQTFHMAFYYIHAEMTVRRGQIMVYIFLSTYLCL
jgi:hypothetical protein